MKNKEFEESINDETIVYHRIIEESGFKLIVQRNGMKLFQQWKSNAEKDFEQLKKVQVDKTVIINDII